MIQSPEFTADAKGHLILILRGDSGAITVEAWETNGIQAGILEIHSGIPIYEHQEEAIPCQYTRSGFCYPTTAFQAGQEAGLALLAGREGYAAVIARDWYRSHIDSREE